MKKSEDRKPGSNRQTHELDRRTFVKMLPAAGVAGLAAGHLDVTLAETVQQPPATQPAQRVTKEMLHATEQLIGVELNDEQETMALRGVNQNLSAYEGLRKIDVPLDTEPATAFHPALPGKKFDWKILTKAKIEKPFFVSGGISLEDVEAIKKIKHPDFYGIDINSKFEKEPGVKDMAKVLQLMQALKKK